MKSINKRLQHVRRVLNLTQEQMAHAVGLTKGGISQMEQDQRPISARHIKMLSLIFGVNEQWLLTGDGDMFLDRFAKLKQSLETDFNLLPDESALIIQFISAHPDFRRNILDACLSLNHSPLLPDETNLLLHFISAPSEQRRRIIDVLDTLHHWKL